jgi:hypothetical protein
MGSPARTRIRPVSRETKFLRLRSLNCFEEVHKQVVEGLELVSIAKYIQVECNEYVDVGREAVISVLKDYRQSLPAALLAARVPRASAMAAERVREGLDELEELDKLYQIQLERIGIDFATERKINKLIPSMTQEIRAGREILTEMAKLKMDLGLNDRHLGKVDIDAQIVQDVTKRYDVTVSKTLTNPESRRKLLGIAERFLSLAAGNAGVDLTVEDDSSGETEEIISEALSPENEP